MADAGFFKGTSTTQDTRFKDKEKSLLKSIRFPPELDKKVDMRKVELSVMRPWIAQKVIELLGFEDEVVVEYINGLLEDAENPVVDPKRMQINLTGFLETKTSLFMSELWTLLLSAQESSLRVPALFIEQKKEEMRKREEEEKQKAAEVRRKKDIDEDRERRLAEIRARERDEREDRGSFRGRGRGRGRGGHRGGGSYGHPRDRDNGWAPRRDVPRAPSRSRSPPPYRRRRSPSYSSDSRSSRSRSLPRRRRRSPSYSRSRSRSRSPPRRRRSPSYSRSPPRRRRRSPSRSLTPPRRRRSASRDNRRRGPVRRFHSRSPPRKRVRSESRSSHGSRTSLSKSPAKEKRRLQPNTKSPLRSRSVSPPRAKASISIKGRAAEGRHAGSPSAEAQPKKGGTGKLADRLSTSKWADTDANMQDSAVDKPRGKVNTEDLKERLLKEKVRASMKR